MTKTADTDQLAQDVADARERVTRVTEALKAARANFAEKRDQHASAALLAEFDTKKADEKQRLESEVSAARARIRDLEGAAKAAEAEVVRAEDTLRRATAGDALSRAEGWIAEREVAMSEAARLIDQLGKQIDRAEQAGRDARRAAMEFSLRERDSVASSAVDSGVVRSCVEALMWRAGLRWLTNRTTLADSDDVLARMKYGHWQKVEGWRQQLPTEGSKP